MCEEPSKDQVVSDASGELRTLSCKIVGVAHLFQDRKEPDTIPFDSANGSYGIGLILEEIGEEVLEIGRSLDEYCVARASCSDSPTTEGEV